MAKKSKGYGGWMTPAKPAKAPAAPRDFGHERTLCDAIGKLAVVELKYKDDMQWRTFQPHCVHHSSDDQAQVNVYGEMTSNPNEPNAKLGPRNFEIGRLTAIRITDAKFERPREFDRFAALFKAGIICCV